MTEAAERTVRLDVYRTGAQATGTVLVFLSYCALPWFRGIDATRFLDVYDIVAALGGRAPAVAGAYYTWLGWTLLALCALGAALAATRGSAPVRLLTGIVGLAAAAVTVLAVRVTDGLAFGDFLARARAGFYVALAGYVLIALGAVSGARTREPATTS